MEYRKALPYRIRDPRLSDSSWHVRVYPTLGGNASRSGKFHHIFYDIVELFEKRSLPRNIIVVRKAVKCAF